MRVLAWPAFRKEAANPHAALLSSALMKLQLPITDWTPARALLRTVDIWHLHHPESVVYRRNVIMAWFETITFLILLTLAKWRGTKVLWTIHDLGSNDQLHPLLEAFFWQRFLPAVDHTVCLSKSCRDEALKTFPQLGKIPCALMPHGHYLDAYPNSTTRAAARRALGLSPDAKVILHFGLIRPYKNAPKLIEVFRTAAIDGAVLVVAGRPFDRVVRQQVEHAADGAQTVKNHLDWVPPERVQDFFVACDLVALPYRKTMNSGVLFLALSFARPVLVPDKGSMREHAETFGASWMRLYDGELLPQTLSDALVWACETDRAALDLSALSWENDARSLKNIYESLTDAAGGDVDGAVGK